MLRKLLFGAGMAYAARKFMGGRDRTGRTYNRGGGLGSLFGGARTSRRGMNW